MVIKKCWLCDCYFEFNQMKDVEIHQGEKTLVVKICPNCTSAVTKTGRRKWLELPKTS